MRPTNTIYSLLQTQPLVASHQLMISFTFSFGYIKLGYQSSSVLMYFVFGVFVFGVKILSVVRVWRQLLRQI